MPAKLRLNWLCVILPSSNAKAAFSKAGTICPRPNLPSEPPFGPLGPVDLFFASSAKSAPLASEAIIVLASSSVATRI